MPIIPRSELTGARRERVLPWVGLIAGVLQCAAALTAVWIGSFARPLGVALFGAVLLLGYGYHQRLVYGAGDLGSPDAFGEHGGDVWVAALPLAIGKRGIAAGTPGPKLPTWW